MGSTIPELKGWVDDFEEKLLSKTESWAIKNWVQNLGSVHQIARNPKHLFLPFNLMGLYFCDFTFTGITGLGLLKK